MRFILSFFCRLFRRKTDWNSLPWPPQSPDTPEETAFKMANGEE